MERYTMDKKIILEDMKRIDISKEISDLIKVLIANDENDVFRIENIVSDIVDDILENSKIKELGISFFDTELGKFLFNTKSERNYSVSQIVKLSEYFRVTPFKRCNVHYHMKKNKSSLIYNKGKKIGRDWYISESDVRDFFLYDNDVIKKSGGFSYRDVLNIVEEQTGEVKTISYVAHHFRKDSGSVFLGEGNKLNSKNSKNYLTLKEVNKFLEHKGLKKIE